jgi:hypothetical protein
MLLKLLGVIRIACLFHVIGVQCGEVAMENGIWSDFLTLEVSNSSYVSDQQSVFARVHHTKGTIVCELAGDLIPVGSTHPLTVAPVVDAPNQQQYFVIGRDDSVCFKINDCIDPSSEDFSAFPGCEYNAAFAYTSTGKLLIAPLRDILPGEEIFVFFGSAHWSLRRANFGVEPNYYATYPSLNHPLPAGAIDSDYLSTFVGPSLLGVGSGLFAKFDIAPGSIICELKGPAYRFGEHPASDKLSGRYTVGDTDYVSASEGLCSLANDAAHVSGRVYSATEFHDIYSAPNEDSIPTMPGFSQNSMKAGSKNEKAWIVSIEKISAGAEILYSFGR